MKILDSAASEITILMSTREAVLVNNALNEVCNGIAIPDGGFIARIGASRAEVRVLLQQLTDAIPISN